MSDGRKLRSTRRHSTTEHIGTGTGRNAAIHSVAGGPTTSSNAASGPTSSSNSPSRRTVVPPAGRWERGPDGKWSTSAAANGRATPSLARDANQRETANHPEVPDTEGNSNSSQQSKATESELPRGTLEAALGEALQAFASRVTREGMQLRQEMFEAFTTLWTATQAAGNAIGPRAHDDHIRQRESNTEHEAETPQPVLCRRACDGPSYENYGPSYENFGHRKAPAAGSLRRRRHTPTRSNKRTSSG